MRCMVFFTAIVLLSLSFCSVADQFSPRATYSVCFTPGEDCTQEIVDAINNSVSTIWVQAYSFTSRPIGKALVVAKERGVDVRMLVDKSVLTHQRGTLEYFVQHGIPVWIQEQIPGIAHNKVMVLDQTQVITGSFNFTYAAQQQNAENVLVIDDAGLAQKYLQNWQRLQHNSQSYTIPTAPLWQPSWLEQLWMQFLQWLKSWL